MAAISRKVKKVVRNLTHLEVNTIIKPNMTGRKMPHPRHALIEIAKRYIQKLAVLGHPIHNNKEIKPGSYESFDIIREKADEAIKLYEKKILDKKPDQDEEIDFVMLLRIKTMSDQIKGIFNNLRLRNLETWDNNYSHNEVEEKHPPLPLETDEIVLIRKIWEMGIEEVAMQTIIQLDGDMITRIQTKYANAQNSVIHKIHNESIRVSLKVWAGLIDIVKDFFQILVR